MKDLLFALGKPVTFEESMTCEFKEVKGQGTVQAIGKVVDEYVVAYLNEKGLDFIGESMTRIARLSACGWTTFFVSCAAG